MLPQQTFKEKFKQFKKSGKPYWLGDEFKLKQRKWACGWKWNKKAIKSDQLAMVLILLYTSIFITWVIHNWTKISF